MPKTALALPGWLERAPQVLRYQPPSPKNAKQRIQVYKPHLAELARRTGHSCELVACSCQNATPCRNTNQSRAYTYTATVKSKSARNTRGLSVLVNRQHSNSSHLSLRHVKHWTPSLSVIVSHAPAMSWRLPGQTEVLGRATPLPGPLASAYAPKSHLLHFGAPFERRCRRCRSCCSGGGGGSHAVVALPARPCQGGRGRAG
jgi:hypothetical protein